MNFQARIKRIYGNRFSHWKWELILEDKIIDSGTTETKWGSKKEAKRAKNNYLAALNAPANPPESLIDL